MQNHAVNLCLLSSQTVLTVFLGLEHGSCIAVHESSQISLQNVLSCVQKMNESLTGLEQHEGE